MDLEGGAAADNRDRLKECVAEVLSQELGVAAPRSFQLNAIHSIACEHKRTLVVQPTGSGKSILVICSAILLMGVVLVVVPLLSVGADQSSSAFEAYSAPNYRVFQVTERMNAGDKEAIISFLMDLKTRADGTTIIYIAAESLRLDGAWSPVIDQLFARGLVSLVSVDEAHRLPMDRFYRPEFIALKETLFDKIKLSSLNVALLVMTATMTRLLLEEFEEITGLDFDVQHWGSMARRVLHLYCEVQPTTTPSLVLSAKEHLMIEGRKIVVYSNDVLRTEINLPNSLNKMIIKSAGAIVGDAASLSGSFGPIMKSYIVHAFTRTEPSPALNCMALCSTSAGNCGLNCLACGLVLFDGLPQSVVDFVQMMGRAGRLEGGDSDLEFAVKVVLSVTSLTFLLIRISSCKKAEDRRRQTANCLAVLKLLLLSQTCIHVQLEKLFEEGSLQRCREEEGGDEEGGGAYDDSCTDSCWVCRGDTPARVSREEIVRVLSIQGFRQAGGLSGKSLVAVLSANKQTIWEGTSAKRDAHRLVLCLVAAEILTYDVVTNEKDIKHVVFNWRVTSGEGADYAYKDDTKWDGIPLAAAGAAAAATGVEATGAAGAGVTAT